MTTLLLQILLLLVLCALSAFFSGSETILFSVTPAQRQRIRARDAAADEDTFSYCRSARITQAAKDEFSRILAELAIELPASAPEQKRPEARKSYTGIL